jgi:hypothetical protein
MVQIQAPLNNGDAAHNVGDIRFAIEDPHHLVISKCEQKWQHGIKAGNPEKSGSLRHGVFAPACLKVHEPQKNRGCG